MIVVISGIALSYQRVPSRAYFEENLVIQRDDPPVMVEHPGEVILEALEGFQNGQGAGLTLLLSPDPPEYGYYLQQLEDHFGQIEIAQTGSLRLLDQISQAASILKDRPNCLVVISETTQTGSAAVVLSSSNQKAEGLAAIHLPAASPTNLESFELAGFTGDLDQAGLDTLAALIEQRKGGRPVSLVCPRPYGQPEDSLLNLIHICLSIKTKTLPDWSPPSHLTTSIGRIPALHTQSKPRSWLGRSRNFQRSAALIGKRKDKKVWEALLLQEIVEPADQIRVRPIHTVDPFLFLIRSDDQAGLTESLGQLSDSLAGRETLAKLAHNAYAQYSSGNGKWVCSLLANSREGLQKEINHAQSGLNEAFRTGKNWTSPAGSYFTPQPLGHQELAFVYPGAFNSYPGMAQNLFFSFPGLQEAALEIIPDLSSSLAEDMLSLPEADHPAGGSFTDSPAQLIESGISLSVIYTLILKQVFGLTPAAAFGYSLGETSMLWANNVWQDAHRSSEIWNRSPLFKDQLVGKMQLIREAWENQDLPEDFWGTFILKDRLERVESACQSEELVSLTIQNSADEIVIAGEKNACSRVIQELGCHALPMPLNAAIHHPAMLASQKRFQDLYDIPTSPRSDIRFYTAASYDELAITQQNLARSIAQMTCNPVDFPRLVKKVYEDGVRIFVEVGPQKTCSRWIEKILKDKPHAVLPINKRYQNDYSGILKVLAMLLSQGVRLDLSAVFPTPDRQRTPHLAGQSTSAPLQEERTFQISQQSTASLLTDHTLALTENLDRISSDLARSQSDFLAQQSNLTKALTRAVRLQGDLPPQREAAPKAVQPVLFSRDQIQAFTNGDHRVCFGDLFSSFGNRRFPRLPNGPLQLIDRVIKIDGKTGSPIPGSTLVSEVDLHPQAWYWSSGHRALPHVALMEIALQPCGFLSAYLGTIKGREDQDIYFRNLDGEASLLHWPDQLGPVITSEVKLESSSSLNDVIIQKFTFTLYQGESPFFSGSSSFGYFPLAMLLDQAGLDGTTPTQSWRELNSTQGDWLDLKPNLQHNQNGSMAKLPVVDRLWIAPNGGNLQQGYVFAEQDIPEKTWFYQAHFFQDPVMPGSLGVETMARSLMAAASTWEIPDGLTWRIQPGSSISWKYRGQITPENNNLELGLHLKSLSRKSTHWEICADGELWCDSRRIYRVDNLCLESIPVE